MSYNNKVETYVKGDLVYFTGYQIDSSPLAHKVGIVMNNGVGPAASTLYEILWLYDGSTISVEAKHLTLAYTRE